MPWKVPNIWEGGECWIIGGGPSMPRQFGVPEKVIQQVLTKELTPNAYSPYMKAIHKKHVIGVNTAFLIGDWIDIMFYGDKGWFLKNREQVAEFPGLKLTCHPSGEKYVAERIKYLSRNKKYGKGISPDSGKVCWNGNSGAAAISIAAHTGVKRIVLVGFDMTWDVDLRQHWHGLYGTFDRKDEKKMKVTFDRHKSGFSLIARDAKKRGLTIINACPDSTITEFEKVTVKSLL